MPPPEHREAIRPRSPHGGEARVRVPQWRGHPSREQAR